MQYIKGISTPAPSDLIGFRKSGEHDAQYEILRRIPSPLILFLSPPEEKPTAHPKEDALNG